MMIMRKTGAQDKSRDDDRPAHPIIGWKFVVRGIFCRIYFVIFIISCSSTFQRRRRMHVEGFRAATVVDKSIPSAHRDFRHHHHRPFSKKRHNILFNLPTNAVDSVERNLIQPTTTKTIIAPNQESPSMHGTHEATTTTISSTTQYPPNATMTSPTTSPTIWECLAQRAAICLYQSDLRRDAIISKNTNNTTTPTASSATNWIHDASAFALQKTLDRICFVRPEQQQPTSSSSFLERDATYQWFRWMQMVPSPTVIDLSTEFHRHMMIDSFKQDTRGTSSSSSRSEFLSRIVCRMIVLPSGMGLSEPYLVESPGTIIWGKLVLGGVTRSRLLGGNQQRQKRRSAGARTEIMGNVRENRPSWMMYGGPARQYEAVDMGPAGILEIILLPRGKTMHQDIACTQEMMTIQNWAWKPQHMFDFYNDEKSSSDDLDSTFCRSVSYMSGRERNDAFRQDFVSAVGGLQVQIDAIVRRVLDGRVIRPAMEDDDGVDESTSSIHSMALEAAELEQLGLTPVRGLLLYGPPGCGKTALAREISRALRARTPKIVSAPELLDRWVGGSEKLVRLLFADAEAEFAACNGDATKSALHVIVIDEIDAVFRKRSSAEDSGEATRSSVVNQILAKLDGVNAIPNVLLVGMTNRKELLDEALLRPGRLEVQIEIPLPDKQGRREILQIHFGALRRKGRLSKPLCCAIDGVPLSSTDKVYRMKEGSPETESNNVSDETEKTRGRKRHAIKQAMTNLVSSRLGFSNYDLADDSVTGGWSGADLAGLVRCAGSIALSRCRKDGSGVEGLLITLDDVKQALTEVKR